MYEQSLYLDDLFSFLALEPHIRPPAGRAAGAGADPDRLRLRGRGVPLSRARSAGRCAASTSRSRRASGSRWWARTARARPPWSKLLARLYDPTEGRILLDGVDLREYDVESLRRNVGVIFQDFVRYDFLLRENIAVGNIERAGGRAARSRRAAQRSLADTVARPAGRTVRPDARPPVRGRGRSLGRRVAEGGAGAGLHARRPAPHPRRAHRRARRAGGVRGLPPLLRAHRGAGWRC